MATVYGNTESTASGNSSFRVVCEYDATNLGNGYYQYKYRFYVQVTKGNFYSSTVRTSWGTTFSMSGTGKYSYSRYYTKNVAYGSKFTLGNTAYAQYTSSTTYRSEISGSKAIATVPKPTYAVKYNANGGSGAPSSQTKTYGTTLKLSTTKPTRTGYTFQGWATSASGSVAYAAGANYTANAAVTLYAVWKANTYTVKFDANGGTGAPGNQTKTYGVNLTLSSTKPTRTNYNFLGWGTSAASTTVAYAPGATYSSNAAITLYAIWELAYTAPRITNFSVDRCNSSGTLSDEGMYVRVKFGWETDKTVSGINISWAPINGTGTSGSKTVSATGTSGSVDQIVGSGTIDTEYSWNFTVKVSDSVDNSTSTIPVPAMIFLIDCLAGGKGLAIGKPASREGFDIAFDTMFDINKVIKAGDYTFLEFQSNGRPTITNHIGLANGMWLQGKLASGSFANILRMNEDGQVELNWTTGGLKGRVMKELWSGTWSSGTLSGLTELPYYNVLAIGVSYSSTESSENAIIIGFRVGSNFIFSGAIRSGSDTRFISGTFQTTTGTNLQYYNGLAMHTIGTVVNSYLTNRKVYSIYGLL